MEITLKKQLQIIVNGELKQALVEPYYSLLDTLRDELHLTGTKKGCDEGDSGPCTVSYTHLRAHETLRYR